MAKLRKRLSGEAEVQRSWQSSELKRLAETHADEMNSVRCRETDRLNEMRKRWEEEKEAMGRTLTRELKSLDKEFEVTKEQWENSMRGKLGREYAEKLAKEREAVRAERDRDIEAEIRRIRKATVQVELSCARKG